jgi:hypothetical protein
MIMNQFVAEKFFKQTLTLPPEENIIGNFKCTLDSTIGCKGKLFCGTQAVYFYGKTNYKTVIGKSTKIRLNYRDIGQVDKKGDDGI